MRPIVGATTLALLILAARADAIHFYRGDATCTPRSGELSDDPVDDQGNAVHGPVAAEIRMGHNYFSAAPASDTEAVQPQNVTTIKVGDAVRWSWNSAHCHSVEANDGSWKSGYHYPTDPPESPQVLPGFFDYPVLDETPTLSYVHTFTEPGTYPYFCVHHEVIGMTGTIVVE